MNHRVRSRILLVAERFSASLLRLYPKPFREQYGAEMARAFSELAHEHYARAGFLGILRLGARTVGDTVAAAGRERIEELRARFPSSVAEDLRQALRYLLRRPVSSLVIVSTLALGIGAATAIFSVTYAALLRPLPFEDGDRLVALSHRLPDGETRHFSLAELEHLRRRSRTLRHLEEYHSMSFTLLGGETPQRVATGVVSTGYFDCLGVEPFLGRNFRAEDAHRPVLLLAYDYWRTHFGADPAVIGQQVELNDRDHTVIGVLPPLPAYPDAHEVFMPTTSCPFRECHVARGDRDRRLVSLIGRLAPGVTLAEATAEVGGLVRGLEDQSSRPPAHRSQGVRIVPAAEELARQARPTFLLLLAAVTFVLLAVCANAAHLTLTRLVRRERELLVRTAFGAGKGRLVRQMTAEGLLLAGLGGVLGLGVAREAIGGLSSFAARFTLRADEIRLDAPVLLFTLAMVVLAGVVLGTLPVFPGCRHLADGLREGSWGHFLGARRQRFQRLLVIAQLAVSFVLLVGAGLMLRTFLKLQEVDPGFHSDNVLTLSLDLNWSRYATEDEYRRFFTELLGKLSKRPDVESVAVAESFPPREIGPGSPLRFLLGGPARGRLRIQGRTEDPDAPSPRVDLRAVSVDYFETLGIEIREGQGFGCHDTPEAPPVAVVNRSLAERYFGGESPVGRLISVDDGKSWTTIVGVAADVKPYGLVSKANDEVYVPLRQRVSRVMTLLVRARDREERVAREMKLAVAEIDPQQAVAHLASLSQIRHEALAPPRTTTVILGTFAFLALALTATGISGVLGFFVSQKAHDIGVRMALGARRETVLWMVMGDGMFLALVGLGLGAAGALGLSGAMSELLFEVEPTDPWTFLATALLLLGVAAAACFVPARWATSVQPANVLRQE